MILTRGYNVDRFGYLIPHRYGNLPMDGAVATFRPGEGRFGEGAIVVEEGTTNLLGSSINFNTWSVHSGASRTATGETLYGAPVYVFGVGSAGNGYIYRGSVPIQSSSGVFSVYIKPIGNAVGKTLGFNIRLKDSSENEITTKTVQLVTPSGWSRLSASFDDIPDVASVDIWIRGSGSSTSDMQWHIVAPQLEAKSFPTSFVDGTRAAGRLSYPVNFNMDEGTIRCYFYLNKTAVINARTTYPSIFLARQGTGVRNWLWVYFHETRTYLAFQRRTDSGSIPGGAVNLSNVDELSDGWHDIAIVWDHSSGVIRAYLDGEFKGTAPYDKNDLIPLDRIELGYRHDASGASNLLYDELLILPYAASEEEILAWYEADGPIPPHPDALLQWDWQAVRPATMVAL